MSFSPLGFSKVRLDVDRSDNAELVQLQSVLRKVLAFTGRSIDDVVNDPITKNQILGYYKLHKLIVRRGEIGDLERQWNDVPLRGG